MESPVKKLNLKPEDKENQPGLADPSVESVAAAMDAKEAEAAKEAAVAAKPQPEEAPKPAVAPTIKPEELDEPLLQENPQRFVLFPIKYHEVRDALMAGGDA